MNGRKIQENNVVVEVSYSFIKLHCKLFYTVLELHLDQWNAIHVVIGQDVPP